MSYFWRLLVSIDQFFNVLLSPVLNAVLKPHYRFGNEDETLSSVFGKNVELGSCKGCYYICRVLHLIDPGHCKNSIERDENHGETGN